MTEISIPVGCLFLVISLNVLDRDSVNSDGDKFLVIANERVKLRQNVKFRELKTIVSLIFVLKSEHVTPR